MAHEVEVDNNIFGYHVKLMFGKVYAEIYYKLKGTDTEFHSSGQEFGSIWRHPVEKDYVDAKTWCENQIKWLQNANI